MINWKNFVVPALALVFLIISYRLGYLSGKETVQAEWDKVKFEMLQEQHSDLSLGLKQSYQLGLKYEEKEHEIIFNTDTIVKEIPVYIKDTTSCPKLPDGWRLLHNKAVGG